MRIILASASPRRKELLARMGMDFEILPAKGEEHITKESPAEAVRELALNKAQEIAQQLGKKDLNEDILVIGADTVVAYEGKILGKPKDEQDAVGMLTMLSGNTHSVYTGVALLMTKNGRWEERTFYEETKVTMYPMSHEEIAAYVASGEPMDKAGAYGIQGKCAIYIKRIEGDYNNVVGLPVARIYQELKFSNKNVLLLCAQIDVAELTEAELNAELEKGYADMTAGRTKPARQVFADIRKDYSI